MRRIGVYRPYGLIVALFLGLFAQVTVLKASDPADEGATQEVVVDGNWSESPGVPVLEEKRYSRYAIEQQLEQSGAEDGESVQTLFYVLITLIALLLLVVLGGAFSLIKKLAEASGQKAPETDFNKLNARLLLGFLIVFLLGIVYEIGIHSKYILPDAASEHGQDIDAMLWWTVGITGVVFVITQALLFIFSFKYQQKEGQTALYYPKNDKLEILWTTIPAIVLTVLVLFGFRVWVNTTILKGGEEGDPDPYEIEVYAYQFAWKFRYPGADGKLGNTDYRLTMKDTKGIINEIGLDPDDEASLDDIVSNELILPKGARVTLHLRSRDVLHAAHLPHFRSQMYCVPGTPTQMTLKPLYTTEEYRERIKNPEFNFELACNQICGGSHYNMRREIKVVEVSDYESWMQEQKALFADLETEDEGQLTLNK